MLSPIEVDIKKVLSIFLLFFVLVNFIKLLVVLINSGEVLIMCSGRLVQYESRELVMKLQELVYNIWHLFLNLRC